MRRLLIPSVPVVAVLATVLASGSCETVPAPQQTPTAAASGGLYSCAAGQDGKGTRRVRVRASAAGTLTLDLGHGVVETLRPVPGTNGATFANPLWAWRAGTPDSTLTDIENIDTSPCHPASDAASGA